MVFENSTQALPPGMDAAHRCDMDDGASAGQVPAFCAGLVGPEELDPCVWSCWVRWGGNVERDWNFSLRSSTGTRLPISSWITFVQDF